jgi:predicted dehydrogenase
MEQKKKPISRVGIVGCGHIATFHLPAIRKSVPHAALSFCDVNRATAEDLARKAGGGNVYTNIDDMLSKEKPDSVHILTSIQSHYRLAKKGLEAGAHVIAEKPAVETLKELEELYAIADRQGVIFSADHTLLGMPVVQLAREEVAKDGLGRLVAMHCDFGGARGMRLPYDAGHWAYDVRGGMVMNNISHPASLLVAFMDPVQEVSVQGVIRNVLPTQWPDVVHVVLKADDQIGSFCLSVGHGNGDRSARLLFERGYIALDFVRQLSTVVRGPWPLNFVKKATSGLFEGIGLFFTTLSNGFKVVTKRMDANPGLFAVVGSFYRAIESGEPMLVSRENLTEVTRIVEEVWNQVDARGIGRS